MHERMTTATRFELDESQLSALSRAREPGSAVLVTGPPGTGKTRLLIEAVAERVRGGVPMGRLVVLTQTRAAAQRLRSDLLAAIGHTVVSPRVLTIHGLCLALHRRFGGPDELPNLLTAPEQDFRVRELLAGRNVEEWPLSLRGAVGTGAFAQEVRALFTKARQLGLDPSDVVADGERYGRDEWVAVGEFMGEYLDVLDFEGRLDYAELVHRTRLLLADPDVQRGVHDELEGLFCDEFAELDEAQMGVLADLHRAGVATMALADPSTAVFGFRGAEFGGTSKFAELFDAPGRPAERVELTRNHRSRGQLAEVVARVCLRTGSSAFLGDGAVSEGDVLAVEHDGRQAQSWAIAHELQAAHANGVEWHEMAVITRAAAGQVRVLTRELTALGVPAEADGDAPPLAAEPAVAVLLDGLRAVHALASGEQPTIATARRLISTLAGVDVAGWRMLGRALRDRQRAAGIELPPASDDLILAELLAGDGASGLEAAQPVCELGALLRRLAERVNGGADPRLVAWELWQGTDWPKRLESAALGGGRDAANANRDLDGLCAAFDLAARAGGRPGPKGLANLIAFLAAQQLPADTARESDPAARGVQVLTAHRTKGLEWRVVVVTSLEEGVWPAGAAAAGLLRPEQLATPWLDELEPASSSVAVERRTFLLAISRAKEHLMLCSLRAQDDQYRGPSRFLREAGVTPLGPVAAPARPSTLRALVSELRRVSVDPAVSPALRAASCEQLARLASELDSRGRPLAPGADPGTWWGLPSHEPKPGLAGADGALRLSVSDVEAVSTCPRRWFLDRRAAGGQSVSAAMRFGSVIHLLAEQIEQGRLSATQAQAEAAEIFAGFSFAAPWQAAPELDEAKRALERLRLWLAGRPGQLLGTEVPFTFTVPIDDQPVHISGVVDRLELVDGRLVVVDFKTGRSAPSVAEAASNVQLGLYQLAVLQGCFDDLMPGVREPGRPMLVYLRQGSTGPTLRGQGSLLDDPSGGLDLPPGVTNWVEAKLADAVRVVRSGNLSAAPGPLCRSCAYSTGCPANHREDSGD